MNIFKKVSLISAISMCVLIGNSYALTGEVNTNGLRVRKEKSTKSEIITNVYTGDKVEIVEEEGEWTKIKFKDDVGYVKTEFITKKEDDKTPDKKDEKPATENKVEDKKEDKKDEQPKKEEKPQEAQKPQTEEIPKTDTVVNQPVSANSVVANTVIGIKLLPNFMSTTVAQFPQGKELTKMDEITNWVKVTDGTVTGWITKAKVTIGTANSATTTVPEQVPETKPIEKPKEEKKDKEKPKENDIDRNSNTAKKGKINVETAKVRETASSKGKFVEFLDYGDIVTIHATEGDWYKITCKGINGYVSKKLITLDNKDNVTSRSSEETKRHEENKPKEPSVNNSAPEVASATGNEIVNFAKQYLGTKYVVGGKTPETGFDCSGFTRYIYGHFGYSLGTTASSQKNEGTEIARESMQPGDLIIFYDESKTRVGHVGIYIGNGNFIHSANPQRGVVIDNINTSSYYNTRFVSARRIAK